MLILQMKTGWYCHGCEARMADMRQCGKWYHEECVGSSTEDLDAFECPYDRAYYPQVPYFGDDWSTRLYKEVQPPEQNVGSRDFLQMDLPPSQDLEDISHSLVPPPLTLRSCSSSPSSPHLALLLLQSLFPSPGALVSTVPLSLTLRSCSLSPSSPHLALLLLQSLLSSPSVLASTVPLSLTLRSCSLSPSSPHLALLLLQSLLSSPSVLASTVPLSLTLRSCSLSPSSPHLALLLLQSLLSCFYSPSSPHLALLLLQSLFPSPGALVSTVPLSLTLRSCSLSPSSPHLALLLLQSLLSSPSVLASTVPPPLTLRSCSYSPSFPHLALFSSFPHLALLLLKSLLPSPCALSPPVPHSPLTLLQSLLLPPYYLAPPVLYLRSTLTVLLIRSSTPSLLRERNVKRSKQVYDPNPGPSSSQTCVANESTELIVVKEEPMSFDIDDMSNYNMTFVDVNQHESILAETSETPGTSRAESLFDERMSQQSLVSPSDQELETNGRQLQSAQLAEYALDPNSLTSSSQNISSKRKKSEGNGKRGYLTSCETSKTETDIRLHMVKLEVEQMREEHVTKMANLQRKMDIQLDQMKKEHESNMTNLQRKMNIQLDQMKKEHELNMANLQTKMDIQHEAKMKEHEIKMIELTGKTDQIRLKNEEIKKKMELDGTISELTVRKLREKINAIIMKREQVSQVHEVTVQELKQKLNNSYLENQILKMKQDALENLFDFKFHQTGTCFN
ncbi:unnamed protein product [Timema podura]|uniref:Zinc finger PHD-type domain-containing protein n=1 Tax=Timema podura TaxID=61482 RepID=A0ABN7NXD7_TIMPD|nr:unnamed protein product [Timema podura]